MQRIAVAWSLQSEGVRLANSLHISKKAAATLNQRCRSTSLPHGQIMRAKIILQLSEGMTPTGVARGQRTSATTVHRWRNRFEAEGIDGLLEQARSGRPTVIDKRTVDKVMFLKTHPGRGNTLEHRVNGPVCAGDAGAGTPDLESR